MAAKFKISIIILAVFASGLTAWYFLDFKQSNKIADKKESPSDILPIQPESRGDIPDFVNFLQRAQKEKNAEICNSLPEPQSQKFFFGDYYINSPSLKGWKLYCMALVNENPALCQDIDATSHPNLRQECKAALEKIIFQKNDSYAFCYEKFGSLYTSSDEVKNCFLKYKLDAAPEFYRSLFSCLQQSNEPISQIGSKRSECLYDLAKISKQDKLCNLIKIPYPAFKFSTPNCKSELAN